MEGLSDPIQPPDRDYMLTRRCAGGSGQHIIFDCRGNVIACSFIPEEAHLSAGKEIPQIEDRFKRFTER